VTIGKLLDWSQARPPLAKVKAAGYSAAYRYVCSDTAEAGLPGKRLTPTERDRILDAGLDIGLHGEDEAGAAQKGYQRGLAQGRQWGDYARRILGAPAGMTVVAAVDVDIDHDGDATLPQFAVDYLGAIRDGLAEFDLVEGVYGEYSVITGANGARLGRSCYVMTNAWDIDAPPSFCHLHQHGGDTRFPGTDYNDVLRVPHGTWLQTLGGDMPLTDADLDAVEARALNAVRRALRISGTLNIIQTGQASNDNALVILDGEVDAVTASVKALAGTVADLATKATVSDTSASVLAAVATLAAKITDLQDAVAQLQPGTGGGPATITLTGTSTPSAP
jgi:hypothetical protein